MYINNIYFLNYRFVEFCERMAGTLIPSAIYFDLILCLEFSMFSLVRNNLFDLRRCQCEAERIRQNVPECTWVVDRAFFSRSSNRRSRYLFFF